MFSGNAVWQLVSQSDNVTWFVLLSLLFLSVFCWTILFYKLIIWKSKKRQLQETIAFMRNAKNIEEILYAASKFQNISGYFLSKNLNFLKSLSASEKKRDLTDREWEMVQQHVDSTVDGIIYQEESYLPVLSVAAAISPLLGLFGTVWGLVHAFIDISKKQSADIVTVAPGIAEALITTLVGLMVAIPSLMMFYYLKLQLTSIEQSLMDLSDRYLNAIQKIVKSQPEMNPAMFRPQSMESMENK